MAWENRVGGVFAGVSSWVIRRKAIAVGLLLVMVAVLAGGLRKLGFENSPESFFVKNDPVVGTYNRFRETFENDEFVYLMVRLPGERDSAFLQAFGRLTGKLEALEHVEDVTSLLNVRHVRGVEDGIEVKPFLEGRSAEQLDGAFREAAAHPFYEGVYIDAARTHLGVVLKLGKGEATIGNKIALAGGIRGILAEAPFASWDVKVVGAPILDADVRQISERESGFFGMVVFAIMATVLLLVFRSFLAVVVSLFIAVMSILFSLAFMGYMGYPFGMLSPIIPSFMISVGISPSIYLITEFFLKIQEGEGPGAALKTLMRERMLPGFMAVFTTAGGLLAFSSSKVKPVEQIGITMGMGLLFAFLMTLILVPLVFGSLKKVSANAKRDRILLGRSEKMRGLARFVIARKGATLAAFSALTLFALAGAYRLEADYYYLGLFKEGHRIRTDYAAVDSVMAGSGSVELVFGGAPGSLLEPANLRKIEALQGRLEGLDGFDLKAYSVADLLKEINQALHGGDPARYALPESKEQAGQYLLLFEMSGGEQLDRLVSGNRGLARINVSVENLPNSRYKEMFRAVGEWGRENLGGEVRVSWPGGESPEPAMAVTGLVHLWDRLTDYLWETQVRSLGITLLVVFGIMAIMFRSPVMALLLVVPNAVAVLFTLGFMGWVGWTLDPYTILIASIALGILDDDSIHMLKTIQMQVNGGESVEEAVQSAFASAGQAMFYVALSLALAFLAYNFSVVDSLAKFGTLVALTIAFGLIVELFLSPALLLLFKDRLFRETPARGVGAKKMDLLETK